MTEHSPQTYEQHCEVLRTLIIRLSDLQFQLGHWAAETLTQYPSVDCKTLADDINIGYKALNEWVNMRRFWITDDLPSELVTRIADLHEVRQNGMLNYSHFRAAKRIGAQDKALSREQQVEVAVDFLEVLLDQGDKHSVMDAQVMAETGGEEFQRMSIVWDSQKSSFTDYVDLLEEFNDWLHYPKRWRIVVYEVSGEN